MLPVTETATLLIPDRFEPAMDAEVLHTALGKKVDETAIINILGHRTSQMRLAIRTAYAEKYNEDLLTVMHNAKTNSEFSDLCMSLLIGPIGLLARELRKKMDKESVDEIICTANNWELRELTAAYTALPSTDEFRKDKNTTLVASILSKIKDKHHSDYLIQLLNGSRDEVNLDDIREELELRGNCNALVNMSLVQEDARELYEAGMPKVGKPNEEKFINIISKRSNLHLKQVYEVFAQERDMSLVDFIAKKVKSDSKNAMNTSIMAAVDQKLLLVAQLYNSMHGLGTKESSLNRIICLRSEHDLGLLKVLYEERIGKDLGDMVYSETSGEYRNLLMTLLHSTHSKK